LAVSVPGLVSSSTRIDLSRGVVTQTSFVAATHATASGEESSARQAPFFIDAASMAQMLESARSPT
jgi:hypothetical protein